MSTTLIRDLIEIPDHVSRGDFVLRLTEGIQDPETTLRTYVVTPQLVRAFDEALDLIGGALAGTRADGHGTSKAAYLHGSFGSGKSHFMAVLHLLLQGNRQARSIPEFAPVLAKHPWLEGKKFLLVPYHMVGKRGMEQAILQGYVDHVRGLHPDCATPPVFLADPLFRDASELRAQIGDEVFFSRLNIGASAQSGWGDLAAPWTPELFAQAIKAPSGDELRLRLVGRLVEQFFTSYGQVVSAANESYVELDQGLAILSRHAADLGYDALILFLDELILWLASHASSPDFVSREGQKLTKLVEAQHAGRPIPIIGFIARQRSLRELVGENFTGIQQLNFDDVLRHWEARFGKITLEDRNLPAIIEKRVLRPLSEAARQEMNRAFTQTEQEVGALRDILMTSTGDSAMFRRVYPFSPALIETLVALSALLQRERTALKVLVELLVRGRDHLCLGDLVPVGDLYDALADGDEAFSDVMRAQFEGARRLYEEKLRPMLEQEHGVRFAEIGVGGSGGDEPSAGGPGATGSGGVPEGDPRVKALQNDARLVKTLLLAALAPNVESLRSLDARRLAALNHGTIRTPIPGREAEEVLRKVRRWAAQVGEVRISEDPNNPLLTVQLADVDVGPILESVQSADTPGARQAKVRELLFAGLEIEDDGSMFYHRDFTWRQTRRSFDLSYLNIREAKDEALRGGPQTWKILIDYPFDAEGHTPADDHARLEKFQQAVPEGTKTVTWIPWFFTASAQSDLGKLVRLDHLLAGERFDRAAQQIAPAQRAAARSILDSQRSALRQHMIQVLESAYGIVPPIEGKIDRTLNVLSNLRSLAAGFEPRPPLGADLKAAFESILEQILEYQYPAHPQFLEKPSITNLNKVRTVLETAAQHPDGRVLLDRALRSLFQGIVVPLQLGEMGETHFVLGTAWKTHFLKCATESAGDLTVEALRAATDLPAPRGLPKEVQNLLILTFADQTNRSFRLRAAPMSPTLEQLQDDLILVEQELPSQAEWEEAKKRAAAVFGVTAPALRNAANLDRFAADIRHEAEANRDAVKSLVPALERVLAEFVPEQGPGCSRLAAAREAKAICDAVEVNKPLESVRGLATIRLHQDPAAIGSSLKKASLVVNALGTANWDLFRGLGRVGEVTAAKGLVHELIEDLKAHELAIGLAPALTRLSADGAKLLAELASAPKPGPTEPKAPDPGAPDAGPVGPGPSDPGRPDPGHPGPQPPGPSPSPKVGINIEQGDHVARSAKDLETLMTELRPKLTSRRSVLRIQWSLESEGEGEPKP